jgi:3-oxoacyl-[acyl-carrier-protein] synthase III
MGGYQPGEAIPTEKITEVAGELPADIAAGLSIKKRYWLADIETGEHRENNSDMAVKAAERALVSSGVNADELDFIFLATGTPDYVLPPVANLVQERLGIEKCATLEIRSAGAGWVQGLDIARCYIERGDYGKGLVIGSEAISPVLVPSFLGKEPSEIRIRDRLPLYMFGDGAGAAVLTASENAQGIIGGATRAIGGSRRAGIQVVGGGTHAPLHEQRAAKKLADLRVDAVGAGAFTPVMVTEALEDVLRRTGVDVKTIDHCLIPEGNVGWMLDSLREAGLLTPEWTALEHKIFDNLSLSGACGCAAVPLFADHAWRNGLIKPGQRVMLIGIEATKWIYAGLVLDWTAPAPV